MEILTQETHLLKYSCMHVFFFFNPLTVSFMFLTFIVLVPSHHSLQQTAVTAETVLLNEINTPCPERQS